MSISAIRSKKIAVSGFTFVELVIVVMLISTLALMAARPLSNVSEYELQVNLKQFETAFSYAHLLAIQTGCDIKATALNKESSGGGFHTFQFSLHYGNDECILDGDDDVYDPAALERYSVVLPDIVGTISEDSAYSRKTVVILSGQTGFELTFYATGHVCNPIGEGQEVIRFGRAIHDSGSEIQAMEVGAVYHLQCKNAYINRIAS